MSIKHIFSYKDVPIPSGTTKEEQRVWSGWCEMGDREVVREAAVKGVHVHLAVKFLATRNHTIYEKAQTVFNQEVNLWIHELLNRKQIFRASHILNNMKLDPVLEMTQIFVETDKKDLRDYIGDHLCKINKMPENFIMIWNLLKTIENKSNILSPDENYILTFSEINKKDHNWRCKVGTKLFFSTFDFQLKPYLEKETMWEFLLKNNSKSLLKFWIDLSFSENQEINCDLEDITNDQKLILKELFKSYEINKEMIDLLCENSTCIENEIRDFVLNELCKFGMFCSKELDDVVCLIRRIINTTGISKLYDLIKKNQISNFLNSFTKHCLDNKYYIPLNVILNQIDTQCFDYDNFNSEHLNIIISTKYLATNFRNDNNFIKNIFDFSKLLSNGDLHSYFIENPIIFLSLVLFNNKNLLLPIKGKKSEYLHNFEIDFKFLEKALEKLPVVKKLIEEINTETSITLTLYDLLEKHANMDVKTVFNFRFLNESSYPTFTCNPSLLDYTYNKKVNFLTYIRQERPSIAALNFFTSSDANQEETVKKIEKFAYKNYNKPKLTASCIAFLRMIGEDCYKLRNHIQVANLLDLECDSKGQFLLNLAPESVIKHIENLYNSDIINLMECFNVYNFVDVLKKYKVLINFAKHYETKYPEEILIKLAENNHWLAFLIFVQYFNYPENQIYKVCIKFKNTALSEHLQHALFNDIKVEESRTSLMRERNSRNFFLSRIGVRKTIDNYNAPVDQGYSSTSYMSQTTNAETSSGSSGISEYETEMTLQGEQIDLLKVLVKCHNSTDPPKMLLHVCYFFRCPLLAIFATSYEPDSVLTNWLTWLSVSSNLDTKYISAEDVIYDSKLVQNMLVKVQQDNYSLTLLESFQIFMPENPLTAFLEVLVNCAKNDFNETFINEKLQQFKSTLITLKNSYIEMDIDRDLSYIDNRQWIESVAVSLLAATFDDILKSSYQQTQLLKLLIKFNVSEFLPISLDSLEKTLNMLNCVCKNKCNIRPRFCDLFWQETRNNSIKNYIDELINKKNYKVAFEIGCIEGISFDHIILQKWEDEFERKYRDDDFWSSSLKEFANVSQKQKVLNILEKCCEKVESDIEKYKILKFALEWAKSNNLGNTSDIEKKMWISVLHLKNYDFQFPFFSESQSLLYSCIQQELRNISFSENDLIILTQADKNYIDSITESLLNSGRFTEALKLSKMFGHEHEDLTILTLCLKLAEGLLIPSQLNVEQRLLVNKATHLRKFNQRGARSYKSFQLSNIGTGWFNSAMHMEDFESPGNDTVKILEILSERVKHGCDLAQKVFLTFRISVNIDRSYQLVLECKQPIELLKTCLKEDCRNKLQVIHDFITVWNWSKEKVADFVCEEVIIANDIFTKAKIEGTILWDLDLDRDFPLILQFLPENTSSTLGTKLYSYASALYKAQNIEDGVFKISEFQMIIELLIRSHDCFTADCNMEGISVILRKSKTIISVLLEIKSWKLIVRLLTGVGRYTEMSYIFQILKENDHFEFLLRKGNRKDNGLKIALLEYLKKYCPENRELYRMVALHFTLYSEIAQLWEEEAQCLIKNLIAISKLEMQNNGLNPDNEMFVLLSNSDGTKITLKKAMQNYIHAAEYHLQGEKLMKAMQSTKQAELIALQLSILKGLGTNASCNSLLNLNTSQIGTLITSHLRFPQSLILADAYKYQPDWASALYEQFVVQNKQNYFDSFLTSLVLTDTLANDVSRKFLSSVNITATMVKNMKEILRKLSSVHTKYRIASELGFSDLIEDMLTENQLTYLRDTVWKKGYKT